MWKLKILILVFAISILAQPCFAISGVPDLFLSEAFIAYDGPGTPSMLLVPDGTGSRFTEAHDEQGNVVDATITLYLRDPAGMPIPNFPLEDMWLETTDGGPATCYWGVRASQNTDRNGVTYWVDPALAGGYSEGPVLVMVNGTALTSNSGLPLRFNSPDINGDLVVNLADVILLAGDFFSDYNFQSDLSGDGVLNLSDISLFAQHFGAHCP